MKRKLLSLADWLLLRLRYPFIGRFGWTPDWVLRIHLVPRKPFLALSRVIDERLIEMDLASLEELG